MDSGQSVSIVGSVVDGYETEVFLLQLCAHIFLSPRHPLLLFDVTIAAQQHVVNVGLNIVLNVHMVVPVFLGQLLRFVVGT